jgi:hypothetical protein
MSAAPLDGLTRYSSQSIEVLTARRASRARCAASRLKYAPETSGVNHAPARFDYSFDTKSKLQWVRVAETLDAIRRFKPAVPLVPA